MAEPSVPFFVRDLMSVGVETCDPDTPVVELASLFCQKGLETVVVLEEGHALGIIGQEELLQTYAQGNYHLLTARDVMREGVPQIPPDIPLNAAAQIMLDLKVRTLFLVHHAGGIEYPAAYISYRHFLRHMAARSANELRDLGIHASRQSPVEAFIQRREAKRSINIKNEERNSSSK